MKELLNRWLRLEEINGDGRCPTYLYRWTLLATRWFKVYLHRFVADDWSKDLHDHPKRFITIGLRGSYQEYTPDDVKLWRAPWLRSFPATHIHRIVLQSRDCWTLCVVFQAVRQWGFWPNGRWVQWREYVSSERADKMKSC